MTEKFEKIFVLDTNIILNNANNFITLADSGKNLIILPETVLDEIDTKKSGFDEINFQARSFARLLYDSEIIQQRILPTNPQISLVEVQAQDVTIFIVSKNEYKADSEAISNSIRNDRKILEITNDLRQYNGFGSLKFISLDIMARTRAISLGIPAEPLNLGKKDVDTDKDFHMHLEIPDFHGDESQIPEQEAHISSVEIINAKGKPFIYFKSQNGWDLISEKNTHRLSVPPINMRQKVMSELVLDKNDVTVVTGPAGTGKTLVALSSAMKLIDNNKDKYNKIYYIRRTVISGSKEDELGFLPGTLEEKMSGYNAPMEDSLRKIIQLRKKTKGQISKEDMEKGIEDLKGKYEIEYLYAGHLRGSTLEDGSILIMDEVQNWDITSIRTIISRVGKNSHIIAMGSNNQIDSQYLTKNTNALTFLIDKCGVENTSDVKVKGIRLTNVMRSKLAEWADEELW